MENCILELRENREHFVEFIVHASDINIQNFEEALNSNTVLTHFKFTDYTLDKLSKHALEIVFDFLKTNTRLKWFALSCKSMSPELTQQFANTLSENCTLEELILNGISLCEGGFSTIMKGMSVKNLTLSDIVIRPDEFVLLSDVMMNLERLDLSRFCFIFNYDMRVIAEGLRHSKTLYYLDITNFHISPDQMEEIASAIEQNDTLEILKITENSVRTVADPLMRALIVNESIGTLELQYVEITKDGSQYIPEILLKNQTLEHLKLNYISFNSMKDMAEALEKNTTLKHLEIYSDMIDQDSMDSFAKALSANNTLEELILAAAEQEADADEMVISIVSNNRTLHQLNIFFNFSEECSDRLIDALQSNYSLLNFTFGGGWWIYDGDLGKRVETILDRNRINASRKNQTLFQILLDDL